MRILYISPENTVGTLNLWKQAHRKAGHECRYVTMYQNPHNFPEDICLNLPLISTHSWYLRSRGLLYRLLRGKQGELQVKGRDSFFWEPGRVERLYFRFRDRLWSFYVEKAIQEYNLFEYDIYHFEWGLDFYRNCSFMQRLKEKGKHIVCTYHGQDIRNRGVLRMVDRLSDLNLTSELDLLRIYPKLKYLFLPFDTGSLSSMVMREVSPPIRVCHAPTNRYFKGSEFIIEHASTICEQLGAEFVLIENRPHKEVIRLKSTCHIFIDQIANLGGWGYGMNSVESAALGLCCLTNLIPEYEDFLGNHPFVNINYENFDQILRNLLLNPSQILQKGEEARRWVVKTHDIHVVQQKLYQYYREAGFFT